MNEHTRSQAAFFAAVFAVAFVTSFFRVVRDGEYVNWSRSLAFAFTSGGLSFGLVAICRDYISDDSVSVFGWIGLSAVFGIMSKEQDAFVRATIRAVWKRLGIEIKDPPGGS